MVRIATDEARANLAELVLRASRGETILITEGGCPMAKLVPVEDMSRPAAGFEQTVATLRDIRSRSKLAPGESLQDLLTDGRKH